MQTINDLKEFTFPALLKNSLEKFPDHIALSMVSGQAINYEELGKRITEFSLTLYRLGLKKGDKVILLSTSMPNWGAAYFSIVNQGIIAVPLLPDFNAKEIEVILLHAEVSGIIISEKMADKIAGIPQELIPFIITLESFSVVRGNIDSTRANAKTVPEITVDEQDTASIIYTSGTTGRSKGVELTHKNLVFTAIQSQCFYRVNKYDRCLSFLPLSHVYEFTLGFVMQMLNGAAVYYLEKPPTVSSLLPALKKIRPTTVLSVPLIMEKIYKNKIVPTFTKTALLKKLYGIRFFQKMLHRISGKSLKKTFGGKIQFFGIGGAKVDPLVEQFMKDAKFNYAIGYGLTETSPLVAGTNPKHTKPGFIGPVMQGIEIIILDPDPVTGIGEVAVRGDNVMKGYYKDPEMTKAVFTEEGWFKTGDLGLFDSQGYLSLKGRLKNMILGSSGENIYPEDIEFVLNQHPLVNESLVIEDGAGLVALVQLNEEKIAAEKSQNTSLTLQSISEAVGEAVQEMKDGLLYKQEDILNEIKFFVNDNVNKFSKIGRVQTVGEFEKTASQKIKRYLYNLKNASDKTEEKESSETNTNDKKQ